MSSLSVHPLGSDGGLENARMSWRLSVRAVLVDDHADDSDCCRRDDDAQQDDRRGELGRAGIFARELVRQQVTYGTPLQAEWCRALGPLVGQQLGRQVRHPAEPTVARPRVLAQVHGLESVPVLQLWGEAAQARVAQVKLVKLHTVAVQVAVEGLRVHLHVARLLGAACSYYKTAKCIYTIGSNVVTSGAKHR